MEKTNQELPQQRLFLTGFARFEDILMHAEQPAQDLGELTSAHDLPVFFHLRMLKSLKIGPAKIEHQNLYPAKIIAIAQDAASIGAIPFFTVSDLKNNLQELEQELIRKEMWHPSHPFWWQPIPPTYAWEESWHKMESILEKKEVREQISSFSKKKSIDKRWIWLPEFLPSTILQSLSRELQSAEDLNVLTLRREGVGQKLKVSSKRTDLVRYVAGTESELINHLPTFSRVVQWLISQLINHLRVLLPDTQLSAPKKVMLSRYPASSAGFNAHVDNPGGQHDNGRAFSLIIYLNHPDSSCVGGELAIWNKNMLTSQPPSKILPVKGGAAVMFDSRVIPHQVLPLKEGADRWALVLWFNDRALAEPSFSPLPKITLTDVLLPIKNPFLPSHSILFHELNSRKPEGKLLMRKYGAGTPRIGIVSTVYQSSMLDIWCKYHFSLGIAHLILIFDHLEEPSEEAMATQLRKRYGPDRLTIWSGEDTRFRWKSLPDSSSVEELLSFTNSGASSFAISARQTLNASVALQAAKTEECGGSSLDWLLHLDDDELFYLEGASRGGVSLEDHFNALTTAGIQLARYLNHELLIPANSQQPMSFKINPRLAEVFLGVNGWKKLAQYLELSDTRPYFHGYTNGKSAICVKHGEMAAGMHSWKLKDPTAVDTSRVLAGPSILHCRFPTLAAFQQKYIAISDATVEDLKQELFERSSLEHTATCLIRQGRDTGANDQQIEQALEKLHHVLQFSDDEIESLSMAGLLFHPKGLPAEMTFE